MRFGTRRLGKSAALMAALAVAGAVPIAQQTAPAQQQRQDQNAQTPTAVTAPVGQKFLSTQYAGFNRVHPIWLGRQKRGNRRHRSRFNYNR